MEAFRRVAERWHDFYLLAGTAAVTLMGLLFVSLSIHIEKVVDESGRHLEAMARQAFTSFLMVLFVSLLLLSPGVARRPLAFAMLAMGLLRGIQTASRMRAVIERPGATREFGPWGTALRFLLPVFGSVLLAVAGGLLIARRNEDGLAGIMVACVLLLGDATRSSYELLVRTARRR
jgi:hypothetical protein